VNEKRFYQEPEELEMKKNTYGKPYEENGKFYRDRYDGRLGALGKILDIENNTRISIGNYEELRDLLGMTLHYIEPVYWDLKEESYCGMILYFINDAGAQKVLMVNTDSEGDPVAWIDLYE
jgi:hypothetical protein